MGFDDDLWGAAAGPLAGRLSRSGPDIVISCSGIKLR